MRLILESVRLQLGEFSLEISLSTSEPVSVITGPSGAGKTTLLEIIAGLRRHASGRIVLDDTVLQDSATHIFVPAKLRRVGYVPQDLALFPHLSVRQNILYSQASIPAPQPPPPQDTLDAVLEVMELGSLLDRSITQLSGGEKQRVALARALAARPRLLLLDEPLTNLDLPLKHRILAHLLRLRTLLDVPLVYVTHSPDEWEAIGGTALRISAGRIQL